MDIYEQSDLSSRDIENIIKGLELLLKEKFAINKIFTDYNMDIPTVFEESFQEIKDLIVFFNK